MKKIAFLGLGAMGSRMAQQLAKSGYELTIWNRNQDRVANAGLPQATIAGSPREAAAEADIIISMVRDDDASHAVWLDDHEGALWSMPSHAVAIECSTLSYPFVAALSEQFRKSNRAFVDAPLAGSRPQAEAAALIFFVGASKPVFEAVKPILTVMGKATHYLGDNGSGTLVKLMVNGLFATQLACLGELLGLGSKANIDLERVMQVIASTPVCSPAAALSGKAMLTGSFQPAFPIELVHKDFQLISSTAKSVSANIPLHTAVSDVFLNAMNEGHGGDNITGVIQLYT